MTHKIDVAENTYKPGMEYPSMGGLGTVRTEDVTRVRWSDGTELLVADRHATAVHEGKRHHLTSMKVVGKDHHDTAEFWTRAITERLNQKARQQPGRLANMVREGWSDLSVADVYGKDAVTTE